jgi:hypothetical protein
MMPCYKKYLITVMFVLLSMGVSDMAFVVPITNDDMKDAGQYMRGEVYPGIVGIDNAPHPVSADTIGWNSNSDADSFANAINIPHWLQVESAVNIWSADQFVDDSLSGLHAGTYRITPIDWAFERDSLNWSNGQGRRWEMNVKATEDDYILGGPLIDSSNGGYDEPEGAFIAVSGYYLDSNIAEGGSNVAEDGLLNFSINDINSINNFGKLTFEFTKIPEPAAIEFAKIPEPATILLLGLGLMGIQGIRRFRK